MNNHHPHILPHPPPKSQGAPPDALRRAVRYRKVPAAPLLAQPCFTVDIMKHITPPSSAPQYRQPESNGTMTYAMPRLTEAEPARTPRRKKVPNGKARTGVLRAG